MHACTPHSYTHTHTPISWVETTILMVRTEGEMFNCMRQGILLERDLWSDYGSTYRSQYATDVKNWPEAPSSTPTVSNLTTQAEIRWQPSNGTGTYLIIRFSLGLQEHLRLRSDDVPFWWGFSDKNMKWHEGICVSYPAHGWLTAEMQQLFLLATWSISTCSVKFVR